MPDVRRFAWLAACATLIALILLGLAWELILAPLKPGGSWLVLKVMPLMAPLFGILRAGQDQVDLNFPLRRVGGVQVARRRCHALGVEAARGHPRQAQRD